MTKQIRRSWLLVPMSRPDLIARAAKSGADAIVLDLAELVTEADKSKARADFAAAIKTVQAGGAAVFAQVDPTALHDDLIACVWPGLSGIVVIRAESTGEIDEAAARLGKLEAERGIPAGTLQIIPALETARGNHAAYEICTANPRVSGVTLGRADLVMDLRGEPSNELHLMQRLIIVATAAGVTPIGAWWRAPDRGLLATAENTSAAALRGRAIGFKGAMCLAAHQVEPLNRAYG